MRVLYEEDPEPGSSLASTRRRLKPFDGDAGFVLEFRDVEECDYESHMGQGMNGQLQSGETKEGDGDVRG